MLKDDLKMRLLNQSLAFQVGKIRKAFGVWKFIQAGLFLSLLGGPILPLQGQTFEITGRVRDEVSSRPIPDVNISLVERQTTTTSDKQGYFRLQLAPGEYVLRFRHVGYFSAEISVEVPQTPTLDVVLEPRELAIPGMMIESTRIAEDSLSTNFVLSPRSLANAPALGEVDPFRAVAMLPGVTTANDLKGELHVRGGGADENLIILDGMEIQNPFHLLGLFGIFNVEALQDVQFYPSSISARYGDRLSSALILRSKQAEEGDRYKTNISLLASSVRLQKKWKKGGVMTALRRTYFDLVARAFSAKLGYYFYDGNFHLTQTLSPDWKMETVGFFNTDRVDPDEIEETSSRDSDRDTRYGWGNCAAALILTRSGRTAIWQNQISLAKNYIHFAGTAARLHVDNSMNDFSGRSQIEWQKARFAAAAGIFAKQLTFHYNWQGDKGGDDIEEVFYEGVPHEFRYQQRQAILGGFVELNQQINPFVTTRAGVRASAAGSKNLHLLPRFSASLNPPWKGRLRLGVGDNLQWQAFGREGVEGAVGSPLFPLDRALRVRIWSLALEQDFPGRLALAAEIYHKNFFSLSRLGKGNYPTFEFGAGKARGIDLFVSRDQGNLTFQAGYGWLESIYTFGREIYPTDWDIRHSFKGLFGLVLGRNWSLHVAAYAQSGAPYTPAGGYAPIIRDFDNDGWQLGWVAIAGQRNSARLPKYVRADLLLRKRWRRANGSTELYFQVLNVIARRNTIRYTPRTAGTPQLRPYLEATTGLPLLPSIGIAFEF